MYVRMHVFGYALILSIGLMTFMLAIRRGDLSCLDLDPWDLILIILGSVCISIIGYIGLITCVVNWVE